MTKLFFETNTIECIRKSWLCNGVYIFQCKNTKDVLYIGGAPKQPLAKRFSQHFGKTDSGATFFDSWKKSHPSKSFEDFRKVLEECRIKLIYFDRYDSKGTQEMVKELECALLNALPEDLQPKYNRMKPKKWNPNYISCECIKNIVDYINDTQPESA